MQSQARSARRPGPAPTRAGTAPPGSPLPPRPSPPPPAPRGPPGPSADAAGEESTMSLLISAYKRALRPPPPTAAPEPPHNLRGGGQRAMFGAPRSTRVAGPRRRGGREAAEVARPRRHSLHSRHRQPLPRPARPRRRRTGPGKSRGGERRAAAPVPRSPPTSRSRARRALPGRPSPWGKGRARGFHGAEEAAARRTRGGRPLGLSGGQPPPSRARQDAWGLVRPAHPRGGGLAGPGSGPPPQAGRIRQGPRPRAGGGRVPAAGRAGRPAGGRRVAAAPGLK